MKTLIFLIFKSNLANPLILLILVQTAAQAQNLK